MDKKSKFFLAALAAFSLNGAAWAAQSIESIWSSGFKLDTLAADDAAQLADMTLEVTYREGSGIESAVLEHIGQYDGRLRLLPIAGSIDPSLFDRRDVIRRGATTVWDLSSLRPLLERLFGRND